VTKIRCIVNLKENNSIVFKKVELTGVKVNNKISYRENGIMVTILLSDNKIIMKRVKDDSKILLEFEEGKTSTGKYFINNSDLWLPLNTFTDTILVDDSYIRIEYQLDLDDKPTKFLFEIRYEVIE